MPTAHLAIDLGASSGRAIVGVLEGDPPSLRLEEVHRFEHLACPTPTGPVWDLTGIWLNVLTGLRSAANWSEQSGVELTSVGVDTWGVDWGLLGQSGELLALPHCYRDPQNAAAHDRVLQRVGGFARLYERTGLQDMPFNTVYQVEARMNAEPGLLDAAKQFVFLPDLLHYWLSGEVAVERTIASTSAMLQVESGDWDRNLLNELGIPTDMLGAIVDPGATIGSLRAEVAGETGVSESVQVIAPASHDTASAVAAVPAEGAGGWAYLSSGTWSLLGAELPSPSVSDAAREAPFTHERGVDGTIRFLKNIGGLWLVQELQRDLAVAGTELSHAELAAAAETAEPFRTLVDPNHADFAAPGGMVGKLRAFAAATGQPVPESPGQLARCCLESLACCYATTLATLEAVTDESVTVLHLVGGGVQNRLLNQLTADAVQRPITTGPVEATAIGNLLVQAMGCGLVENLDDLRSIVRRSFDIERLEPGEPVPAAVRDRYAGLVSAEVSLA